MDLTTCNECGQAIDLAQAWPGQLCAPCAASLAVQDREAEERERQRALLRPLLLTSADFWGVVALMAAVLLLFLAHGVFGAPAPATRPAPPPKVEALPAPEGNWDGEWGGEPGELWLAPEGAYGWDWGGSAYRGVWRWSNGLLVVDEWGPRGQARWEAVLRPVQGGWAGQARYDGGARTASVKLGEPGIVGK